jgi:glycosyltransferase involved in cell wall biosynthesis
MKLSNKVASISELDIVVPCFNEKESLPLLLESINQEIKSLGITARVIIVDDDSSDGTSEMISDWRFPRNSYIKVDYLKLSTNVGQMAALQAGFEYSTAPFILSMDADQQHPPSLIKDLWNQRDKAEVVSMRQIQRQDKMLKAMFSGSFYFFLKKVSGLDIKTNVGDFRMYSRAALVTLLNYKEHNKVFRFTIEELSINQLCLDYEPAIRKFGETKYSYRKMVRLAVDSILGSSSRLLRISLVLSSLNILFTLFVIAYISSVYFSDGAIEGWISILGTLTIISTGLFSVLAILSIYVQRILNIVAEKPRYRLSYVKSLTE